MVCYARPASRMAVVVLVVLLLFGRHVGHFFDTAALMVAITVAAGGAAAAAALAFAAFLSIRRRRAAAGGCVSCQLRCQHAMTEQPHRLLVVRAAEREATGPRWPDRPAYRSGPASRPALSLAAGPGSAAGGGPACRARRPPGTRGLGRLTWSADKDAERVPGGVGVDPQRLLRVIRAILQQPGAERERPLMLDVEVSRGGHRGVQVQLLRDRAGGHVAPGSSPTFWKASAAPPAGFFSTSQSCPFGSGWPGPGGSSPGRYRKPNSCR